MYQTRDFIWYKERATQLIKTAASKQPGCTLILDSDQE